jgi:hypothetical protein
MNDTLGGSGPDYRGLYALAASQHGMVTAPQARGYGFSHDSLSRLARQEILQRRSRGIYRWRDFPGSPYEAIAEAWLRIGNEAVASHETALVLHDLTDLMPRRHHFIADRRARGRRPIPGVTIHTRFEPLPKDAVQIAHGIPTVRPEIAILETAIEGSDPIQIDIGLRELRRRGMLRRDELGQWFRNEIVHASKAKRDRFLSAAKNLEDEAPTELLQT